MIVKYFFVYSHTVPANISIASTPPSPIMAGGTLTLTCSVSLPAGIDGTPVFRWEGPGEIPTPANPTSSGGTLYSDLPLNVIAVSQAGPYKCIATLGGSIDTNITVTVLGMCLRNILLRAYDA